MPSLQQECVRLLTAWAEEEDSLSSMGGNPISQIMEMGEGAGIRRPSGSKPLIYHRSKDHKRVEKALSLIAKTNPDRARVIRAYAKAGCPANLQEFALGEAIGAFEMTIYLS